MVWVASTRIAAPAAVALGTSVALVAAAAAYGVAPRHRWLHLPGPLRNARPRFQLLGTEPTFGPLGDRRSGAPMLEIGATAPALWRMQTLDVFDGYGWRVATSVPELPQPAAEPVRIGVRVDGLRNTLIAAPGRIDRVEAPGPVRRAPGETWQLASAPWTGAVYHVTAEVVRPSAQQLSTAPPPSDPRLRAYTRLGWSAGARAPSALGAGTLVPPLLAPLLGQLELPGLPIQVPLFGRPLDARVRAALGASPYRGVAALARRLAAGAATEWQVVGRVQRYLLDGDRFRYTTDVPAAGQLPLVDFLLRDRAGYCQHFAAAAALLLRLAGVPARMVAGFATGVQRGGRYVVRDVDAHDWIEVYFEGYGWVPFNPTPAAAPAAVPAQLDLLAPRATGRHGGAAMLGAALAAALAAAAVAAGRARRGRPQLGDRLERLLGPPADGPTRTLRRLGEELDRRVGPHTSALAFEAERARFADGAPAPPRRAVLRLARALARDVGPWRAARLLIGRRW
jgi:transglutaminase-like putative cysteine protease